MAQSKAFTDASHALNDLSHALALLEAENAKLRELVRNLLTDPDAWDYDYFKWRMRELGIEVD